MQGLGQFVLKFWTKIRRDSRKSCKLNTGGVWKIGIFQSIVRFISKTAQDTAIVTMKDEQELICDLPNGAISNYLHTVINVWLLLSTM